MILYPQRRETPWKMPHQRNSESVDNVFSKLYIYNYIYIYCILSYCTVLDLPTARIYHPFKIEQKEELKHSTLPLWQPYLSSLIFVTTHAAWNCNFHSAHASKTKPRDPVPQPNEKTAIGFLTLPNRLVCNTSHVWRISSGSNGAGVLESALARVYCM